MKVLILLGSPRENGNTFALASALADGLKDAQHDVETASIGSMKIGGCLDCGYCRGDGVGKCSQRDDMQPLYGKLAEADMVVFASPIYYWSFTAQMQAVITRFFAQRKPAAEKYVLLLSSASDNVYDAPISQYKHMIAHWGAQDMGIRTFFGPNQKCQQNYEALYSFGKSL